MGLTLSTADAALKEDYQASVREQLNHAHKLLSQVGKNTEDIEGRRAVLSLHVTRSPGVGARADGGTLPTAGNQGYAEERVPLKFNYGRIKLSGPTIRAMRSDKGSFVRAVDSETKGITNDLKRDVNRQCYGTSDGVIADVKDEASSTTVTLAVATTDQQMRQIENGMVIDIGTVADPTLKATARTVSAVDFAARTFVISGAAVDGAATDKIFRSGNGGAVGGVGQKELTGLRSIVLDSGTLFNVDPTTYTSWVATRNHNSGTNRAATENLFAKVMHAVEIASGEDINLWVTSDGVFRAYSNNLTALKRFPGTLDLKGGFSALSITAGGGEVGLIWDRDNPANTAFGLNTKHLVQYEMSDWEWMDEDGAVLSRVSGEDAYEAVLFKYHELATDQRNAHAIVKDLLEA